MWELATELKKRGSFMVVKHDFTITAEDILEYAKIRGAKFKSAGVYVGDKRIDFVSVRYDVTQPDLRPQVRRKDGAKRPAKVQGRVRNRKAKG